MHSRLLTDDAPRTFAVVFDQDEDVLPVLEEFATAHSVAGASFTGIGAFRDAALSLFDPESRTHVPIPVTEHTEVLSLTGNIALKDGQPSVHMHAVLGRRDGSTVGGHVQRATVRPTLEVVVTEFPSPLTRRLDEARGLPVIDLDADR
ncbi:MULTISPECIES: PPC domain-containing DNA-binding protein [unclassified Streptomyces]|uniref:PPC domain-containing DNA-binding protein n=1 Tax=unclassified Streptomyces TaxID=2593676 RepID=UPI0021B0FFA2|nr:PPC domain-containing DNA-binding protein [Streptomyces sp. BHT-5-2]